MSTKLRILCDVDGVLADFVTLVLDYVQGATGMRYQREAVDQWDNFAAIGCRELWPYFRSACDDLELCSSMQVMQGARELWSAIEAIDPDAKVCTTPMTVAWLSQRAAWLADFGVPLSRQIQTSDKEALAAPMRAYPGYDVLIDDKVENCHAFQDAGGYAFCIAAPYNTHVRTDVPRGTHAECIAWLREMAGRA